MNSILQEKKECFFTHSTEHLDKHHIYFGANRKVSDEHGFWVWLAHDRHIQDSVHDTPHNNRTVDLYLKEICQEAYEEKHSHESFVKLIGRNYLEVL